jgi:glycosyltransferase involved in cell wall biosynthesis
VTEAAACGVPTVCFDDSGAAETIDANSGHAVAAGDEMAMAAAILSLLHDEESRRRAALAARAAATRFDAPVVAAKMHDVFCEVASA